MTPYEILVGAEHRLTELVEALDVTDLARPTPCAGWDVRALLSHTLAGIEVFAASADNGPGPTSEDMFGGGDRIGDDPVGATKRATSRSQAAWADLADPGAEVNTILGVLPMGKMMAISAFATIVHGWDLAIASGQTVTELPAGLLAHARAVAEELVPPLRGGQDHSLFQAELPAPADATPTQRLMAFLGRPTA
ncbi:TIGR03086 family protein [Streptosporangiaceae bacterium NEAU-GS5]|nr:TIGR03086 family protein [Streptosporangiaceae bacterium NEAU-GS5]